MPGEGFAAAGARPLEDAGIEKALRGVRERAGSAGQRPRLLAEACASEAKVRHDI